MASKNKIKVTIGIMAHNEEGNIDKLLTSLQKQKLQHSSLEEIIIVSSGSTDETNNIIKKYQKSDKRIKLITEPQRTGKVNAVNLFIKNSSTEVLSLCSADLILMENTIEHLIKPFMDKQIGITGAHPIPIQENTLINKIMTVMWDMHHLVSLQDPKMGELIAFRKVFTSIDRNSSVDETNIEYLINSNNLTRAYAPNAIVFNQPPKNIKEIIRVRRRIYCGHLYCKRNLSYTVSTLKFQNVLEASFLLVKDKPLNLVYLLSFTLIEIYSRILGLFDFHTNPQKHVVWQIAPSTKTLAGSS